MLILSRVKKKFKKIVFFFALGFASDENGCIFAPHYSNNDEGLVVQLVRIHACHAWGRGFESRPDRQYKRSLSQVGGLFLPCKNV